MKIKNPTVYGMSEWNNPKNKPSMGGTSSTQNQYPSKSNIESSGHEMKVNPPRQLAKTKKKFGKKAEKRQRIAIMLNKARKGK